MRIIAISDLHGFLPVLDKDADLLIVAGDVCPVVDHSLPRQEEWLRGPFTDWLNDAPVEKVIGVAGNHDFALERIDGLPQDLPWTYLDNGVCSAGGLWVWGTPLSGQFGKWAFMRNEEDLERLFVDIPTCDIIVSHGPPKGWGDRCANGYHAGSPSLTMRLEEIKPRLVVCGHIHEARGVYAAGYTTVIGASHVDLNYNPVSPGYTLVEV